MKLVGKWRNNVPYPFNYVTINYVHKINKLVSCFKMSQWHEKEEMRHVTLFKQGELRLRPEVHKLCEWPQINKTKT